MTIYSLPFLPLFLLDAWIENCTQPLLELETMELVFFFHDSEDLQDVYDALSRTGISYVAQYKKEPGETFLQLMEPLGMVRAHAHLSFDPFQLRCSHVWCISPVILVCVCFISA
jgi:hypothetical protein